MVQPVALSVLLSVFAAQPLLCECAGGGCTARDGMCFAEEMAASRGEQLLQTASAMKRPHKDAPDVGEALYLDHPQDVSSKNSAKKESSVGGSKSSSTSSKKSSISGDGGKKFSFGSLAKKAGAVKEKSPAVAKDDSKQHSAKQNRAKPSGKVSAKPSKHAKASMVSAKPSKVLAALKRKSPSKSSRKKKATSVKDQHALLSEAKGKAAPKHGAKSDGEKTATKETAKGLTEKVVAKKRAPKSPGKAAETSSLKPAKGATAGIKKVAPTRELASLKKTASRLAAALKKQRSEPAGRGKGDGVSPAKGATASQTKVKPAKGTKLKSKVIVIAGGKKAKTKLTAKKGKVATRGKASEAKVKVSVVRGKAKSKKKRKSEEDMEEEEEDMEEEEEVEVKQHASTTGTVFNPVIMSVVLLMSAPAGILLLGFGVFLWAKSQEDESMGATVDQ